MKSFFIFLILSLVSLNCYSNESVEFSINTNKTGNVFFVTATGNTDVGSELLDSWYKKASELCGKKKVVVEPNNGKPIVRNTRCSDAIKFENGVQKCEVVKASVFGKVLCKAI